MPIVILVLLYLLGNIFLLLNRGVYWDGRYFFWLLETRQFDVLWQHLAEVKIFSLYYVLRFVEIAPHPILAFKTLAFVSWFVVAMLLLSILRREIRLPFQHAFFIVAVFVLIPSFPVKAELSVFYYSLCNMFFFLGVWTYFWASHKRHSVIACLGYLASGTLFFLSFFTNSFLVFFGGFLLVAFWNEHRDKIGELRTVLPWIRKKFFFILLPIGFWIIKIVQGPPITPYNEFIFSQENFGANLSFIKNIWNGVTYGLFWPFIAPIAVLQRKTFVVFFAVMVVTVYALTKKIFPNKDLAGQKFNPGYYIAVGLFFFFLGLAPYVMVGKAPHIFGFGFSMRHALLLPLGSSLIIIGMTFTLIKERWQFFVQTLLLALFITFSAYNYFTLDMDWYRQKAIVDALSEPKNDLVTEATTLIVFDNIGKMKYQDRNIGEFEYQIYALEAIGQKKFKFVILGDKDASENVRRTIEAKYATFLRTQMFPVPSDFDPTDKPVIVELSSRATDEIYTVPTWVDLKYHELFLGESLFIERLREKLQIIATFR